MSLQFWGYSLISLSIFCFLSFYEYDWRYLTTRNIIRFGAGVFGSTLVYVLSLYFIYNWTFPRAVILIQVLLATFFIEGIRLSIHLVHFWRKKSFAKETQQVLIIGAGDAGESLIRDMLRKEQFPYNPIGFLDDDPAKKGTLIRSVPVLGNISEVGEITKKMKIKLVILAIPSANSVEMRRIVTLCETAEVEAKKVPSLFDILDGRVNINEIKDVEPEDILGRDLNIGDREGIAQYLAGKVIMVTGAGGSIGSELCRQIMSYNPKHLILLDNSEFSVYAVDSELTEKFGNERHTPKVGDIQSQNTMDAVFKFFKPQIVFHAAAYKHVPLMEVNVSAAVKNNIWGTKNIATMSAKHGVERFVMISTDKAVNPTNVMGSK